MYGLKTDKSDCVDSGDVYVCLCVCVSISWPGRRSCSLCTAPPKSWSSCWSSAPEDSHYEVMRPCHSRRGHQPSTSHSSRPCVGDPHWSTRAKSSSQAWKEKKKHTDRVSTYFYFVNECVLWCCYKVSPCAVSEDVFAVEGVNGHILLHRAVVEDGVPAVEQNLILRDKELSEKSGNRACVSLFLFWN